MSARVGGRRRVVAGLLLTGLTAPGCAVPADDAPSGPASATATRTTAPATSPPAATLSPSPAPSAGPASESPAAPPDAPPVPTAPAPSTAGGLTESDIAVPDGWSPTARPGSPDDGFLGNGTWVHATSPAHSAFAAISLGCTDLRAYPQPAAALEGTLTNADGAAGVGLVLEFADAAEAQAYFAEWVRQAEACLGTVTQRLALTADTWVGRRNLDTVWSETVGVRGASVSLLIVDDPDTDLAGVLG
ncbi:hypothetical protein TESS_TESS_02452 [Tessaracoccus sp. O5.2]|uniref:hypothetical protein n=1 Tax=Tessaracoccus sp. O5.2 TaxID=3157622 RepID=UPI0035EE7568